MRLRQQRFLRRRRGLFYGLSVASASLGCGALLLGYSVASSPEPRDVQTLAPGAAYTAPERVSFVGDLVVYGTPPEGPRPGLEELGCMITEGGGELSTAAAAQEDRIVVEGVGLVPLVSFPGREGFSVACSGSAAVAAAPLYVVPGTNSRELIPVAGYSVASLALPLGAVGLIMLRASRR